MKVKKRLNIILITILCFTMLSIGSVSAITSLDDYNDQKDTLQEEKDNLEQELEETQEEIEKEEAALKEYQEEMNALEEDIDKLNIAITDYNNDIEATQKSILDLELEIEKDYVILGDRLRSLYMAGETHYLSILLDCEDMATLVDTAAVIQAISEHDNELIAQLNENIAVMEEDKQKLIDDRNAVEKSKEELESASKDLDTLYEKTQAIIKSLESDKEETEEHIHNISEEQEQLSDELLQFQKEYAAQNNSSGSSSSGSTVVPEGGSGRYIWPAPECPIITSYWGDGRNHKGWDFACNGSAYGKPIVAAADGVIITANKTDEWGSGWGYYILVDHGDGYSTLSAHCSYITVNVGQQVKQGEVIGYVGNTGNSFGAHLHFECWRNGVKYDPAIEFG